jgi:hypothetical protein
MRTSPPASALPPDVGQSDVAIGQLLRVHAEQPRTSARSEVHAYYMNLAARIEHEVF